MTFDQIVESQFQWAKNLLINGHPIDSRATAAKDIEITLRFAIAIKRVVAELNPILDEDGGKGIADDLDEKQLRVALREINSIIRTTIKPEATDA